MLSRPGRKEKLAEGGLSGAHDAPGLALSLVDDDSGGVQ
jgi:hypothetical protein